MGEVTMKTGELVTRLSALFNNQMFSDVQFLFDDKEQIPKLYGHKLILALRSDYFASVFYDNKEALHKINIPASTKESFYLMLRFLYTDDIQFHSTKEAEDLLKLAQQYAVKELASKCFEYLLKEGITISNIFQKYECALKNLNMEKLLKNCRTFVCHDTESVFASNDFYSVSAAVLEDIIKLNDLMLPSENLLINVVLTWCKVKCKINKVPPDDKHLRECISPFLKYIRFLTLTQEEFKSFVEKYNILNGNESCALTFKILQPDSDVKIPDSICSLKNKRGTLVSNIASAAESSKLKKYSYVPLHVRDMKSAENNNILQGEIQRLALSFRENSSNVVVDKFDNYIPPLLHLVESPQQKSSLSIHENLSSAGTFLRSIESPQEKSLSIRENLSSAGKFESKRETQKIIPNNKINTISYKVKNVTQFPENSSASQLKATKFRSSPNINTRNPQASDYSPSLLSDNLRTFSFPLSEVSQSFRESFPRDIKCSATFKMLSGNIRLFGFELNVRNKVAVSEELTVDVDVRGFSNSFSSRIFKKELKNNVFVVKFSDPVTLCENQKGEIEVSIDNLLLNRCSVCSSYDKKCELNNGTKLKCEMFLSSNQKFSDNEMFFLISKLLYMPSRAFY